MNDEIITSYLLGKKAGGGGTPPVYEEKNVSITQNGDSIITAESGYDAISKVNLSVNVPQPSGKISITQNGTDIDVSSYATADVSVPAGADLSEYFDDKASGSSDYYSPAWLYLVKKLPTVTATSTNLNGEFAIFKGTEIPEIINLNNVVSFQETFKACKRLINVDFSNRQFSTGINNMNSMFENCTNMVTIDLSSIGVTASNTGFSSMFAGCTKLKTINLSNFAPQSINSCSSMFSGCTSLEEIDISSLSVTTGWNSGMFTNVPTNCLILVKNQTIKSWIESSFPSLTNVQIKGA